MTAIMDLSFPGQRTATATSCIPHDSVYMPGPRAGKSENGFFRCDTWLQIFQNDSKICEAEVTLTPHINKICKPGQGVWLSEYLITILLLLFSVTISSSQITSAWVIESHPKAKSVRSFHHINWRQLKGPRQIDRSSVVSTLWSRSINQVRYNS